MKHSEFYVKYKTSYTHFVNPVFGKKNGWKSGLIVIIAVLIAPFIMYKRHHIPFSLTNYGRLTSYFVIAISPLLLILCWANWREVVKRKKGYGWFGKFEVIKKWSLLLFDYLLITPGKSNKVRVNRSLFNKIREGDAILIRRDVLGGIEEIQKINNFHNRLKSKTSIGKVE